MNNPAAPIPSTPPQPTVSSLPVESLAKAGPVESRSRRWLLWLFGGLAVLTLGIAIGVFGAKFLNQSQRPSSLTSTPTPAPSPQSPTPSLVPDLNREPDGSAATANWKTYTNSQYKFSLKYPVNYSVEENKTSKSVQVIFNKNQTSHFSVKAQTDYPPNQPKYFFDTPAIGVRKIGEITWNAFFLAQGYQDAGNQDTTPIYALQIEQGQVLYSIRGFQSEQIPDITNQILSTFKFLDK